MNVDCTGDLSVLVDVLEQSILETMDSGMQPGEMQEVNVYELCGQAAPFTSTFSSNSLYAETTVSLKSIVTSQKSANDIFNDANQALVESISSGDLAKSINTNSGGTITAIISDTVVSTFDVMTNPPTAAPITDKPSVRPTNRPSMSKSAKNAKTQTQSPTKKPLSGKAGKISKIRRQ